jgi:hypothetical protein
MTDFDLSSPELAKRIDESPFGAEEWRKSLDFLARSAKFAGKDLQAMLGFVSCCAEYAAMRPNSGSLLEIVEDFEKLLS